MGFIVCIFYISNIWRRKFGSNLENYLSLTENLLPDDFPPDDRFSRLKLRALRHAIVFTVFAALIYFVYAWWLTRLLLWVYLAYALFEVYCVLTKHGAIMRAIHINPKLDERHPTIRAYKQALKAAAAPAVYTVYLFVLLFLVSGL